ncbi:MAG: lytic murein transglycosylase [Mariprofundales bacterium]
MPLLMRVVVFMLLLAISITSAHASTTTPNSAYIVSKAVLQQQLVNEFPEIPLRILESALQQARFQDDVLAHMRRPYEDKPYYEYRTLFVDAERVKNGRVFMQQQRPVLLDAQARFGVQSSMITAILGIETRYGNFTGDDKVLDTLYTLAVGYPERAAFFRRELGQFLLLIHEENNIDINTTGSYAGAMGMTQMISSSYRAYAIDGDGDGWRDLWSSPQDIVLSVANYFSVHGWDEEKPVAHWLSDIPKAPAFTALLKNMKHDSKTWYRLDALLVAGLIRPSIAWHDDDKVRIIFLQDNIENDIENDKLTPVLIHYNFYVITRWNHSERYAMAACELAAKLGCQKCK